MNWLITKNNRSVSMQNIPLLEPEHLLAKIQEEVSDQKRVLAFFGLKENPGVKLIAALADDENSKLYLSSALFLPSQTSYPSLTPKIPSLNLFEREFYEDFGIKPYGHPWLKPVRYPHSRFNPQEKIENYPFYSLNSEEIHQIGVGPVHAGIIEPGHFRFHCQGENILHLETQLGYQHRGIESLIVKKNALQTALIESIAGDSLIGHTSAYANAIESLSHTHITRKAMKIRAIALELERVAIHLGDLSAICNDIAYLLGSSVFGAIRTTIINSMLEICGSRFGKSLIQLGGVGYNIELNFKKRLIQNLNQVSKNVSLIEEMLFNAPSVLSRLEQTGIISKQDAHKIGMVGPAGRASGLYLDIRADHPFGIYQFYPVYKFTLESGDVFARTFIRFIEIQKSIELIIELLDYLTGNDPLMQELLFPHSDSLVISMTEGWRGEIVHTVITDSEGNLKRYKIKDPSFNNWLGLAHCVRENGISDFPLCNKSFNLSYCGFDL